MDEMEIDEIEINIENGKEFVRDRITELRLQADVSEYQMSLELGQNRSYVQSISSGRAMPSMAGFFNICDYFGITPVEFFDSSIKEPALLNEVFEALKPLNEENLELIRTIAQKLDNK